MTAIIQQTQEPMVPPKTAHPKSIAVEFEVPLIIRGKAIFPNSNDPVFGGRNGRAQFLTPDAKKYVHRIGLADSSRLRDLYNLSVEEILDFIHDLGERLVLSENEYLREAFKLSVEASGLTKSVLAATYHALPQFLSKAHIKDMLEHRIGIPYLDEWVPTRMLDGRTVSIRAFGARTVHVIAGNVPLVAAGTLARSCATRCDTVIKTPSNDPITASALALTMIEMEPNHPITKHVSTAYWKGGDVEFEEQFYTPQYVEKIIAWGGFPSIKHITRYLQPGIDLITLDPKLSTSIIGREAFSNEDTIYSAASLAARDVGVFNQEACVCARVIYVESGTDPEGIEKANRFGQYLYSALINLPPEFSTSPKTFDAELKNEIDAIRLTDDFYQVYGGQDNEGAVIVSQWDEPVDFSAQLCSRVANIVPIDSIETAIQSTNAYTQTAGIYPERLKQDIRDDLIMHGVQRIVSLGNAGNGSFATPQDAIEPLRRMVKWVMDEQTF